MRLSSIITKISDGIISFFDDSIADIEINNEVKIYEKRIFSQGRNSSRKYLNFLSKVDDGIFNVDDKSLKQSVRSRVQSNSKLSPYSQFLVDFVPNDRIDIKKIEENGFFNDLILSELYLAENIEIVEEYIALVKCAERELTLRKIRRILDEFFHGFKSPFFELHMQMQLTTSLLSFFDQRFTLKKTNSENVVSELLSFVKCKFYINGRKNYRIIPIAC